MLNSRIQASFEPSVDTYCESLLASQEETARLSLRWARLEQDMVEHNRWLELSEAEQLALPAAREMHEIDARLAALNEEREEMLPLIEALAAVDRRALMLKLQIVRMLLLPEENPQGRALFDSALRDLAILWR